MRKIVVEKKVMEQEANGLTSLSQPEYPITSEVMQKKNVNVSSFNNSAIVRLVLETERQVQTTINYVLEDSVVLKGQGCEYEKGICKNQMWSLNHTGIWPLLLSASNCLKFSIRIFWKDGETKVVLFSNQRNTNCSKVGKVGPSIYHAAGTSWWNIMNNIK